MLPVRLDAYRGKHLAKVQVLDAVFTMPKRVGLSREKVPVVHVQHFQDLEFAFVVIEDGQAVAEHLREGLHVGIVAD